MKGLNVINGFLVVTVASFIGHSQVHTVSDKSKSQ